MSGKGKQEKLGCREQVYIMLLCAGSRGRGRVIANQHNTEPEAIGRSRGDRCRALMASIQRMQIALQDEAAQALSQIQLQVRIQLLENTLNEFKLEFNHWADELRPAETNEHDELRAVAETLYVNVMAELKTLLQRYDPTEESVRAVTPRSEPGVVRVHLADLTAAPALSFDGNFAQWAAFKDAFMEDVHHADMSNTRRLRRLQGAVKGGAARALGTWPVRGESYEAAWNHLCSIYDNDFQSIRAHLQSIFELPAMPQPTYTGIRMLLDTVIDSRRQLLMLVDKTELGDYLLMHLLEERLDPKTKDQWEMNRPSDVRSTLADLLMYMERRASALAAGPNGAATKRPRREEKAAGERDKAPRTENLNRPVSRHLPCRVCRGDHPLFKCPEFLALSMDSRMQHVNRFNLCQNCLKSGHLPANCYSGPCTRCPGRPRHNSVLCPRLTAISKPLVVAVAGAKKEAGEAIAEPLTIMSIDESFPQ